jgi:hypothetical protein
MDWTSFTVKKEGKRFDEAMEEFEENMRRSNALIKQSMEEYEANENRRRQRMLEFCREKIS